MEENINPRKEAVRKVVNAGSGGLQFVGRNIGRLVPKGFRHPDSLITNGPNRSLYLPSRGHGVSILPGVKPNGLSKSLLTGPSSKRRKRKSSSPKPRKLRLF